MDGFRVLCDSTVGYLDVAGSGSETNAHLLADGLITIMFCAFDNPALILRICTPVLPQDERWAGLASYVTLLPGTRQIFVIEIGQVQTSCGWGVPHLRFERERQTLSRYHLASSDAERFGKYALRTASIDGLPVRNPTRAAD